MAVTRELDKDEEERRRKRRMKVIPRERETHRKPNERRRTVERNEVEERKEEKVRENEPTCRSRWGDSLTTNTRQVPHRLPTFIPREELASLSLKRNSSTRQGRRSASFSRFGPNRVACHFVSTFYKLSATFSLHFFTVLRSAAFFPSGIPR